MKKYILISLAAFFSLVLLWFIIQRPFHIFEFPSALTRYYAKQFCSCYYVIKQSEEFCRAYVDTGLPFSIKIDRTNKKIHASSFGWVHQAVYQEGSRFGCSY